MVPLLNVIDRRREGSRRDEALSCRTNWVATDGAPCEQPSDVVFL